MRCCCSWLRRTWQPCRASGTAPCGCWACCQRALRVLLLCRCGCPCHAPLPASNGQREKVCSAILSHRGKQGMLQPLRTQVSCQTLHHHSCWRWSCPPLLLACCATLTSIALTCRHQGGDCWSAGRAVPRCASAGAGAHAARAIRPRGAHAPCPTSVSPGGGAAHGDLLGHLLCGLKLMQTCWACTAAGSMLSWLGASQSSFSEACSSVHDCLLGRQAAPAQSGQQPARGNTCPGCCADADGTDVPHGGCT